jgi:hypothetical protein
VTWPAVTPILPKPLFAGYQDGAWYGVDAGNPSIANAVAAAQGQVNLDSPRFAALMALAVQRGALTEARAADVAAGKPAPR